MKLFKTIASQSLPLRRVNAPVEPVGSLWPNGEFTIGYRLGGADEVELTLSEYEDECKGRIGLSNLANSHSDMLEEKPRRGQNGLTSYGKRVLRNSVFRMQRLYGKKSLAFCTVTLPSCTYNQAWNISSDWARIVRVFFQKLGRHLESVGLPKTYVSVTENQVERSEGSDAPFLHLHFLIVTRKRGHKEFLVKPGEIRWMWASVIGPHMPEVEFWGAVENMQVIKKDASAYMAKYFSKADPNSSPVMSSETGWSLPTAWYNVSAPLRRWVKSNVRKSGSMMRLLEIAVTSPSLGDDFYYRHGIVIEGMSGPGPHAFVGKLRGEAMGELIEIWRAEV